MGTHKEVRMKIIWSGLADAKYYEYIAKYCLPSWSKLPGAKYIVHDSNIIKDDHLTVVDWRAVGNYNAPFWDIQKERKKTNNFWRKMQAQVWAMRNLRDCDFLVLFDTDIEVLDFDNEVFEKEMENFRETGYIWATGRSQSRLHDSGFIVINVNHPQLDELINHYENIWDSGAIFDLRKSYDGHAVESMFPKYPSYKIMNTDYGKGLHIYPVGVVHWGSKLPKQLRREWQGETKDLIAKRLSEVTVKTYKN